MKKLSFASVDTDDWKSNEVLAQALRHAPIDRGYSIGDVGMALRIIQKFEGGGEIVLEDAEYTWLVQRVEKMQWTVASAEIVGMVQAIKTSTDQK